MVNGLKVLFGAILAVMVYVTLSATLDRGLLESGRAVGRPLVPGHPRRRVLRLSRLLRLGLLPPDVWISRWLAALVPLLITVQFALVGFGVIKDEAAVKAMSRTGDRREILRGPLFYGIMFVVITLLYWKDSLIGIPALMMLCGGDGIADIVGRRVNSPKLPWSPEKSVAGSLSVFFGGWLMTVLVFSIYVWFGAFSGPVSRFLLPVTWIPLGATLVESLSFKDVDNLTVPLASTFIGYLV